MFPGILCSDRFSAYLKYHKGEAPFCWAHLEAESVGGSGSPRAARWNDSDVTYWFRLPGYCGSGTSSEAAKSIAAN